MGLRVFEVCVWRLLTKTRRGTVFAVASFREVDVIAWSLAATAGVLAALAAMLFPGGVAPGVVNLIGGAAVVVVGMVLLVLVLRSLLCQAIAREEEVVGLRGELGEVI